MVVAAAHQAVAVAAVPGAEEPAVCHHELAARFLRRHGVVAAPSAAVTRSRTWRCQAAHCQILMNCGAAILSAFG